MQAQASKVEDFDKLLLEAIDQGLSCIGEDARKEIYYHLETDCGIPKDRIPANIVACCLFLKSIFGESVYVLELEIMKALFAKTNRVLNWRDNEKLTLSEYVQKARGNSHK